MERSKRSTVNKKALLLATGFVVAAAAAWYVSGIDREARPSVSIDPREVGFPGMQLRLGSGKDSFKLAGRVRNRSTRFTVAEVTLKLTMEDVAASGVWTTVGTTTIVLKMDIPPGGSGYFEEPVLFSRLPSPRGRHEWSYSVVEVKGK